MYKILRVSMDRDASTVSLHNNDMTRELQLWTGVGATVWQTKKFIDKCLPLIGVDELRIDDTGLGAGIYDMVTQEAHRFRGNKTYMGARVTRVRDFIGTQQKTKPTKKQVEAAIDTLREALI